MNIGKILIITGSVLLFTGLIVNELADKLNWFGKMPLDFNYESEATRIYVPIGSMILLSLIFSIVVNIFLRWFK